MLSILDALPADEAAAILSDLSLCFLNVRDIVYPAGGRIGQVYFPTGAVLSVLTVMHDGDAVEIGTMGREGLSGAQLIFGGDRAPSQTICQIQGPAHVMAVDDFLKHFKTAPKFRLLAQRYTQALFNFMGQSIACNRLHTVNQRCARWLLLTHDRVNGDEFDLTQEFLAIMLGVNRPGVSIAAGTLQEAGYISYRRGHVNIRDRAGLESAACECYRISAAEFERALRGEMV